jgi:hypothetical protein
LKRVESRKYGFSNPAGPITLRKQSRLCREDFRRISTQRFLEGDEQNLEKRRSSKKGVEMQKLKKRRKNDIVSSGGQGFRWQNQ